MKLKLLIFRILAGLFLTGILLITILMGIFYAYLHWRGPLSIEDALKVQNLPPLYYPSSKSDYAKLNVAYYYKVSLAEVILDAYFITKDSDDKTVRVAILSTYRYLSGPSVNSSDKKVPINWSYEGFGRVCEVPLSESNDETFPGIPYQSCFRWYAGEEGDVYILYTIWSEDETVNFVNSLIPAKKDDLNEP